MDAKTLLLQERATCFVCNGECSERQLVIQPDRKLPWWFSPPQMRAEKHSLFKTEKKTCLFVH